MQIEEKIDLRVNDIIIIYNFALKNFNKIENYFFYFLFIIVDIIKFSYIFYYEIRLNNIYINIVIIIYI